MGLRKAIKRVTRSATNYVDRVEDKVSDAYSGTTDKAREAYKRYKDPIITGAGMLLGALVGTMIAPGAGTVAGASLGAGLFGGGRAAYSSRKNEKAARQAAKDFQSQIGPGSGGLADALRRRRLRRGAGEGVAEYESNLPSTGQDAQEVKAA